MRRGIFIAGVVVIIIGVLVAGTSFAVSSTSNTVPVPSSGAALTFTPNIISSGTVTFGWSGANPSFSFNISECSDSACDLGATVASGSGASGSISFHVTGGQQYIVIPQHNTIAVPVTLQVSGLTPLLVVGIVVVVLGAALAGLGYVMKAKPRRVAPAAPAPKSILPPLDRQEAEGGVYTAPPSGMKPAPPPESSGPVFFKPTAPEELYGANDQAPAAPAAPGDRPWIKCNSCGTMNEPWLHNCRWCKRALTTTAG